MPLRRGWIYAALSLAFGAFAVYAAVILLTTPDSDLNVFFTRWFYQGLIVLSVAIAGARAVLVRKDRLAWAVIACSIACTSFAELYYLTFQPSEYPSVADYGWLLSYPVLYVGIVLLTSTRARAVARALWLDGMTASLAAAALGAAVLVEVVLQTTEGSTSALATNLAYPLGDVLLLSAVFGVFSLSGWRLEGRWLVLGLGVLATTIADGVYLFQVDTYQGGTALDVLWPASTLLMATAAWIGVHKDGGLELEGRPLLAVPAVGALVATGVLVYDHFERVNLLAVVLATATILAVILRLAVTFVENRRLFEQTRYEAITDALTGLGNRRKLLTDLDRSLADTGTEPTILMIFDLDGFKSYNDSFGHPAGDALLARLGSKLAAVPGDQGAAYRLGGDEFCLIARVPDGHAEELIDRSCSALMEHGEGFEIGTSFGAVLLPEEASESREALQLADERLYAQKHLRRTETDRTIQALLGSLSDHQPDLPGHLEGVAALAAEIGESLGLRRDELAELTRAARLHDVGKLAVPDEILRKPAPLDESEWAFMRQHTVVGERILRASPTLREVAAIVRSTHENWDGTGYPDGLAGDDIPLAARIIFACDAYDAMTSSRNYARALSPEEALRELERGSGTQFDPTVARVLVAHVRDELEPQAERTTYRRAS